MDWGCPTRRKPLRRASSVDRLSLQISLVTAYFALTFVVRSAQAASAFFSVSP